MQTKLNFNTHLSLSIFSCIQLKYNCNNHLQKIIDLGLTFLEINDRAYVRTVDPGSLAEKAGIQPQDCVQFACVVGGPHFEDLQSSDNNQLRRNNSSASSRRRVEDEEKQLLENKAGEFVLECEKCLCFCSNF